MCGGRKKSTRILSKVHLSINVNSGIICIIGEFDKCIHVPLKPVPGALTVLHLSLLSMNSLNQIGISPFALQFQILLPEDHITRI